MTEMSTYTSDAVFAKLVLKIKEYDSLSREVCILQKLRRFRTGPIYVDKSEN